MGKKKIIVISIALCLLFASLYILERLLVPKYVTAISEGSLIEEYYRETTEHDVIFIGDCEVYGNFSPITMWEKYGITSFIRGSAQQLIWQSYYLLEETLRYEKPDVVVFNVLSLKYNEPQNEAYNRMTLDGMKMSASKLRSIRASMLDDEIFVEYLFPFLRYHSRWNELTQEDFKYWFRKDQVSHNGYYLRVDVRPAATFPTPRRLADYQLGDNAYKYLDKMVELCKENEIELVLIKAPSLYPHWYDQWDSQMVAYAKKHDLLYINFLDYIEEMDIHFETDTYDAGLHLNLAGAEKLSDYFGNILKDNFDLKDRRLDEKLVEVWDKKVDFYYTMIDMQYSELEEYGYLKSFGGRAP